MTVYKHHVQVKVSSSRRHSSWICLQCKGHSQWESLAHVFSRRICVASGVKQHLRGLNATQWLRKQKMFSLSLPCCLRRKICFGFINAISDWFSYICKPKRVVVSSVWNAVLTYFIPNEDNVFLIGNMFALFWTVRKIHEKEAVNDPDEIRIDTLLGCQTPYRVGHGAS